MRKNGIVPRSTPRNSVARALVRLTRAGHGRHSTAKRTRNVGRKDLDQRVRESGEW